MRLAGFKRKRIFLLFFAGIILPSLLLGYLAFRGIKNDQALAEKDRLDAERRNAAALVRALDGSISAVERDFEKALAADPAALPSAPRTLTPAELLQALEKFKADHPAVEEVFVFEAGKLRLPVARLLFWPKSHLPPPAIRSGPPALARDISAAERLEFEQKDYPRALAVYRQLLSQTADPQTRGEILNSIARVQKKSGLAEDALQSYAMMARDFDRVRIAAGIPLGIAARLELSTLQAAAGDYPSALRTTLDLYTNLIRPAWEIEQALYENTAAAIRRSAAEALQKVPAGFDSAGYRKAFEALDSEAVTKHRMALRMSSFLVSAAPDLKSKLPGTPDATPPTAVRLSLELDGNPYYASAATAPTPGPTWGFLLDPDALRDAFLLPLLKNTFPPDETAWLVRGRGGQELMASENVPPGQPTFRTTFEGNFPTWSLELHALNPQFLRELLASRQRVYFLMFLLIAGILVFGMVMAARMVSHELELARMKSGFVSTVSHEFRSPLTSIRQIAEMLQAGRVPSEERRRQYHDILVEQSERLSLLVDNILSLAKIEDGRMTFDLKEVEIGPLLEETVSPIRERVRHEGFTIEMETDGSPHVVRADAAALARAVTNIVDNAVKYSGDSRRIILRSSVQGPDLIVSVQDFGAGIDKDDQGRIFDRFYRGGDPLTRSVKGSGLGLTLVKEIVDAHGGQVRVESKPGAGSTFSVILPLA